MTGYLGTNTASLNAQRRTAEGTASLAGTFERLSSGMRINRASDDAAGLAISSSLKADTRVFTQAIRNVNDGLSVLSIVQGALTELSAISVRQRELAEQAASGSYSLTQRRSLNAEVNALVEEFNRIVESTGFNGRKLLAGNADGLRIQAGYGLDGSLQMKPGGELERITGDGGLADFMNHDIPLAILDMVLGDLNNDGIMDVLTVGNYAPGSVGAVRLGNADGTFKAVSTFTMGNTFGSYSVALCDLNGDGIPDIAGGDQAGFATVRLGNGDGTFRAPQSYASSQNLIYDIDLRDLNGDGIPDMITAGGSAAGSVGIRLGTGNGSFGSEITYAMESSTTRSLSLADLNGDGIADIVTAGEGAGGRVSVRLGRGDGTFGSVTSYLMGPDRGSKVAVEDLDRDGIPDIAMIANGTVTIRSGRGDGTFDAAVSWTMTPGATGLSLGDLNGDGLPDLVATSTGYAAVRLARSDGTFSPAVSFALGFSPAVSAICALEDLNYDGIPDLVAGGLYDLKVLFSTTTKTASVPYLNLNTSQGALNAMSVIDSTLHRISSALGATGSTQSRLGAALNNLAAARENFDAAAGRIQDADIASESANLVRAGILQQAAAAVLAQANMQPALALALLQ